MSKSLIQSIRDNDVAAVKTNLLLDQFKKTLWQHNPDCFALACEKGNMEIVMALMDDHRIDLYSRSKFYFSPLDTACYYKHFEVVKLLVQSPKIELEKMGWSQIHTDFALGEMETCEKWISQFDDWEIGCNRQTPAGFNPFYVCCRLGHLEIVKLLLKHPKVDVNLEDLHGETPLFLACKNAELELIKLLLGCEHIDPNKLTKQRFTPLCWSALWGQTDAVRLLLASEKVDLNKSCDFDHRSPFFMACQGGHVDTVKVFLECPREINLNDSRLNGLTPLASVCTMKRLDMVDLLLRDARIEVNHVDSFNCNELWNSVICGHAHVVKRLLASPWDLDVKTKSSADGHSWSNKTAAEIARLIKKNQIAELLDEYEKDAPLVRKKMRKEFGLNGQCWKMLLNCCHL